VTGKPAKPKKQSLKAKPLPSLRTMTMVKGPGTLSSYKPPVRLHKKDDD
jgi:hypothetical protein